MKSAMLVVRYCLLDCLLAAGSVGVLHDPSPRCKLGRVKCVKRRKRSSMPSGQREGCPPQLISDGH